MADLISSFGKKKAKEEETEEVDPSDADSSEEEALDGLAMCLGVKPGHTAAFKGYMRAFKGA